MREDAAESLPGVDQPCVWLNTGRTHPIPPSSLLMDGYRGLGWSAVAETATLLWGTQRPSRSCRGEVIEAQPLGDGRPQVVAQRISVVTTVESWSSSLDKQVAEPGLCRSQAGAARLPGLPRVVVRLSSRPPSARVPVDQGNFARRPNLIMVWCESGHG